MTGGGAPNAYQRRTSATKLAGRYFSPPELVDAVLALVAPGPDDTVVDPACGDGAFLVGAVRWMARRLRGPALGRWAERRLFGHELDEETAEAARGRVRAAVAEHGGGAAAPQVRVGDSLLEPAGGWHDGGDGRLLLVGNPPFVEAKRLDRARKAALKARYPDAVAGAPDLSLYFLHRCLQWCGEDGGRGETALVLPNKVLVNKQALPLRRRLVDGRRLASLLFATDLGLFGRAAVYPVVVHAGPGNGAVRLYRPERREALTALAEPVRAPHEAFGRTAMRALFPLPAGPTLAGLLDRLLDGGGPRLGDLFDVRWTVSFHRGGLRERFTAPERPASPHARPFLGGGAWSGNGEVGRYRAAWGGWWIDYDEARARAEGNALPPAALFDRPKVALCQNARVPRAAWVSGGTVLKDTLLALVPRGGAADHPLQRHLRALVAVLSSELTHFFHCHVYFGGHVGGGYLHYLRSFVDDLPLGDWTEAQAREAAAMVESLEAGEGRPDDGRVRALVRARFSLSAGESEALGSWAADDPAWQARDRVGRAAATS